MIELLFTEKLKYSSICYHLTHQTIQYLPQDIIWDCIWIDNINFKVSIEQYLFKLFMKSNKPLDIYLLKWWE